MNNAAPASSSAEKPKRSLPPPQLGRASIGGPSASRWLSGAHYAEASQNFYKYDPQLWLPTLNFSVTPFMLYPWAIITIGVSLLTFYSEVINPEFKQHLSIPMDAHVVLGGALSFLVVFRTNSSYDRWWEARCAWQTVVTTCRAIGAQVAPALRDERSWEAVNMQLMAFVVSLKAWLREEEVKREELGGRMDLRLIADLNRAHCPPMACIRALGKTVRTSLPQDDPRTPFDEASLGSAVYNEAVEQLRVLTTAVGVCEKIKLTPMTYGYIATLRSFLVLWLCTLPLSMVGEYGWVAPPALSLITFLFLTVEQMAIEIEQPFGDDANDLPIEDYISNLEATLLDMLPGNTARADEDYAAGGGGYEGKGGGYGYGSGSGYECKTSSPVIEGKPVTEMLPGAQVAVGSPQRVRAVKTYSTVERVEYEYDDDQPQPQQQTVVQQQPMQQRGSSYPQGLPPPDGPRRVSRRRLSNGTGHASAAPTENANPQQQQPSVTGSFDGRYASHVSALGEREPRRPQMQSGGGDEGSDGAPPILVPGASPEAPYRA